MTLRSIPQNPSLEFDKKSAKRLLDDARNGDEAALQRLREHHPRFAERAAAASLALHDAQLVIAREYGFASWPRWQEFVASRRLEVGERAAEVVRAACSGDMRKATTLLAAEPSLSRFDAATATACGDHSALAELLSREPELARQKLGPEGWEPLVYACFSRFLRSDRERAAGIVRCARLLLEHGADPNAHFYVDEGDHRELQTCLYGAAGIANDAELTELLLAHGATVKQEDGEVLYHAAEFRDVRCLELVLAACPPPPAWRGPLPPRLPAPEGISGIVSYCLGRALDFDNEAAALLFLHYGADPNQRVPWNGGGSHLHKAAMNGRSLATLTAMLERGGDFDALDDAGVTPYRYAVRHGHQHLVELFESRGAAADTTTAEERALAAVIRGLPGASLPGLPVADLLKRAARANDVLALERLLDAGASVDEMTDMTALQGACYAGQFSAVKVLLARGASVSLVSTYGGNALGTAIYGSEHCCDPEGGPGTKLREEIGPRQYAEIVELLLAQGAKPPSRVSGSDRVQDVLRRHGVPDAE